MPISSSSRCRSVSSGAVAAEIAPVLKPGAIVTDVGSTKRSVIAQMEPHIPAGVHFIPGHPLAGTEKSGPDSGFAELFENRWCIFTPLPDTDPAALERLSEFWRRCGSNIDTMDPEHHDMVLAIVSHLPHIIAYNIVGTADDLETVTKSEVIKYSASGFRDFTRLAASDPTMWRDVCLHNKDAILEMLARFSEDLASLQRAIRWGDGDKLFDMFTHTRAVRRSIIEAGQDIDVPDFGRQAVEHPQEGLGSERRNIAELHEADIGLALLDRQRQRRRVAHEGQRRNAGDDLVAVLREGGGEHHRQRRSDRAW